MDQRLERCRTIHMAIQRVMNAETNHWNEVFLRIVALLTFQGYNGGVVSLKQRYLLKTLLHMRFIHVGRLLKNEETEACYLEKNIQNEIIHLLDQKVESYIIDGTLLKQNK